MLTESFEGKLKATHVTILERKSALEFLNSKYLTKDSKMKYGSLYRINYKSDNVFFPNKLVIPLSVEEDKFLVCFDILHLHPEVRAKLFDLLITESGIELDNKMFKKISSNSIIKSSIKKFIIKNISSFERIRPDDLMQLLFI